MSESLTFGGTRSGSSSSSPTPPPKLLFIGPDQSGNFVELIALVLADTELLVIHAMTLRRRFRRLLPR